MSALRIDQQVLHVYVALQNLAEGRALNEIADEVGVSRFAAARMVKRARDLGLVEVRAAVPDPIDVDLSTRLARKFGLESAIVVPTPVMGDEGVRDALAGVAARFLTDRAAEDDVIGITPGRTSVALSRCLSRLPWLDVVQLTGVGDPNLSHGIEAIINIGRVSGGATYPLYAPILVAESEQVGLMRHPTNARTVRKFSAVTTAYLTIGGWPDSSLLAMQVSELGEMDDLARLGVVAEIGVTLLDECGSVIQGLEERLIGIGTEQLRSVETRVAVGGGPGKERAVLSVLRSGLISVIVTDSRSATAALESA